MASHLATVRNMTTSFMMLWIMVFLTCTMLSLRYSLSAMRILALFAYYFVLFLGWRLLSSSSLSVSSVFFLSYLTISFLRQESRTACSVHEQTKMFPVFACLYIFFYCFFFNASGLSIWHFLTLTFSWKLVAIKHIFFYSLYSFVFMNTEFNRLKLNIFNSQMKIWSLVLPSRRQMRFLPLHTPNLLFLETFFVVYRKKILTLT